MKTVKVRIALEVAPSGEWHAYGWQEAESWEEAMDGLEPLQEHHVKRHWIEAEVPVPEAEPETLAGNAVEEKEEAA